MRTKTNNSILNYSKPDFVYSTITFNDLSFEAQEKVVKAVKEYLQDNDIHLDVWEVCDSDGEFLPKDSENKLYLVARKLAESSWQEWGVDVKNKGVKL